MISGSSENDVKASDFYAFFQLRFNKTSFFFFAE